MSTQPDITRREFLQVSAVAGVGLIISVSLPGCAGTPTATEEPTPTLAPRPTATPSAEPTTVPTQEPTVTFEPGLFVRIDNRGTVTITVPRVELGQGVRTALAMILAEELEAEWSTIQVETAPADRAYGRQATSGSHSIEHTFLPLRRAGAVAREMLVAAAAQVWEVEPEACFAQEGAVIHRPSSQHLAYGELVETAITLPVPNQREVALKDPEAFAIIGTRQGQVDDPQFMTGRAIFGMDVRVPDMLYATVARCPVVGGKPARFDPAPALAVEGVRDVLEVGDGLAVVANSTWTAIEGRNALEITWDEGRNAGQSSDDIRRERIEVAQSGAPAEEGVLEAIYEMPFLAHATMEPMNCTADVREDGCLVWAPTQDPQQARDQARAITRLPDESVAVHMPLIGGGFGRRLQVDYVMEALRISRAVGAPVQVVWTREDDMRHDYYHPLWVVRMRGRPDEPGKISMRTFEGGRIVRTGAWRAVTNIPEAFAHECFLDELATVSGRDPFELRRELLPERQRAVLELAAEKAGWGNPLPDGWGRGIAAHSTWGVTHVAQVAEVSVAPEGYVRVHRVVCAVDCGIVVNPDMVEAQMEGGIVFGLTAALKGEITIEDGRVQQSNFDDYPLLRMDEMPEIEVYIVPSDEAPQGVGEMAPPPVIPAVVNAVHAATGKRIRRLPIRAEDLRGG